MILGDSLQVMASLAERESLKGKVQCIYFDPPYGIKFNSNWQVSTQSRDVKDGKQTDISREPEQVKAFRDTWKDGIHSYLTYLRDRLTVMRDLLTESGSIFVQIGDENVHRVRAVMDEVFGAENFVCADYCCKRQLARRTELLEPALRLYSLVRAAIGDNVKYRPLLQSEGDWRRGDDQYVRVRCAIWPSAPTQAKLSSMRATCRKRRVYRLDNITSQSVGRDKGEDAASWFHGRDGETFTSGARHVLEDERSRNGAS